MNFEHAIYTGEADNIETHCNELLKLKQGKFFKMRNILMNNAKVHKSITEIEKDIIEGTLEYLAPERVLQQPYDARVDIFSVGIIFYILLACCHPYEHVIGEDLQEYKMNIKYMEDKAKQPNMDWNEFLKVPSKLLKYFIIFWN